MTGGAWTPRRVRGRERAFVAQVVIVIEEVWFAPGDWGGTPARAERRYAVGMHLFLAADEDGAYAEAQGWIDSEAFSDANHDGAGDRTHIFALGLHQLEEVGTFRRLLAEIREPGGVELPGISLADVDGDGVPRVPARDELEVFRMRRLREG